MQEAGILKRSTSARNFIHKSASGSQMDQDETQRPDLGGFVLLQFAN